MGNYSEYFDDDLEVLKGHYYDDWNFGSGKESSLRALEQIEAEIEKRRSQMFPLHAGITMHAADSPPINPSSGDAYFNTKDNQMYCFTGNRWAVISQ